VTVAFDGSPAARIAVVCDRRVRAGRHRLRARPRGPAVAAGAARLPPPHG
jgi:hypothetical protein